MQTKQPRPRVVAERTATPHTRIVGMGGIVLSTGRVLPIRVEIAVSGRQLTKREDAELESKRVALHGLGMVGFRA